MGKYIKEFFSVKDIVFMSATAFISLVATAVLAQSWFVFLPFFLGIVLYVVSEYLTHRFLFHMKPPKHPFFLSLLKRLHYDHHVHPNDLELLFLPIWYSFPQMIAISVATYLLFPQLAYALAIYAGLAVALLYYEWTHYVAHRPIQPRTRWGKWMKKIHLWHHYKNENFWFGVTNPSMDIVFGTFKDEKDVPRSETAKQLMNKK
ncbi:sterol desaturase/sphingolipid hydroxylase (fatty acid hydroxylase superfamily) [Anoxybacillus voinovskiensis]|uniref:Sterol desaturase/sphingolipid hydroxylase (Fatty acid hydroxylase superfamily) n=1 Tax=Anoxybacteroides voinovskiense TaxID=230470 RepID=A0A840DQH8_9BACL|nr:sterol desaturase/sphingolipid hydroxylase (fatty acid hydroxylase superfamily) [Anoxybacillus voinovskiensis]GGJ66210.1 fatty acid hydroxylase [Anoxybacillus voinovskiensis]